MKTFHLVYRPDGSNPSVRHASHAEALTEAQRLAAKHPNTDFFVLEASAHVRGSVNVATLRLGDDQAPSRPISKFDYCGHVPPGYLRLGPDEVISASDRWTSTGREDDIVAVAEGCDEFGVGRTFRNSIDDWLNCFPRDLGHVAVFRRVEAHAGKPDSPEDKFRYDGAIPEGYRVLRPHEKARKGDVFTDGYDDATATGTVTVTSLGVFRAGRRVSAILNEWLARYPHDQHKAAVFRRL